MAWLTDPLELEFMQRALLEVAFLSVPAGLLGTWIVLRRLAFFTHAAGSATFPGLVVAGPWGVPAQLAAFGAGVLYAGGLSGLTRRARIAPDAATGALLVGTLLVLPAASARLLARSVRELQLVAVLLALLEGAGGLLAAYH